MSFGSTPSAPTPASPAEQSAAQIQANNQTAMFNYGLNNPNVITPYGSQTYQVSQSSPTYDMTAYNNALANYNNGSSGGSGGGGNSPLAGTDAGSVLNISGSGGNGGSGSYGSAPQLSQFQTGSSGNPSSTETLSFSPTQQALYDQSTANQTAQGKIAGTALQGVQNQFNTPYDVLAASGGMTASQSDLNKDYNNQYNNLYQQQTAYLDPQMQNTQNQLDASLANQGILPGSAAYNNAQEEQNRNKTFAYQQAANQAQAGAGAEQSRLANLGLQNQAQAAQLYTQQYQQPLNLYNSLETGTQASLPQFSAVNPTNQAAPNVLGAYANNYQGQLNAYNAATGSANSSQSGTMGLIGTGVTAAAMMF